jgi:hypothetical protein
MQKTKTAVALCLLALTSCAASDTTSVQNGGAQALRGEGGAADSDTVDAGDGPLDGGGSDTGTAKGAEAPDAASAADASSSPDAAGIGDGSPPTISSYGLSLRVVGNHLVDAASRTVRLLGFDRSGQEFKCIQQGSAGSLGWGIFDGPTDLPSAQAMASWHGNAVRLPLNEDCWLGINGVNPLYGGMAYQNAIEAYVATLHQAGLYVIVDLHWNAPGTIAAAAQQPLPDADHAGDFWRSVATAFASDPAVVFDLYNEPFLYGSYMQDASGDPWACWLDGCGLNQYLTGGSPYTSPYSWNAIGMQQLVTVVRATGATNPIMIGGLDWSNDLSGWLSHMPQDPQNAILASWHSYPGETCNTAACWTSTVAPVAAVVPVVTGEIGDHVCTTTTYVETLIPWLDTQGISYVGWTWNTWGDCDNVLIATYAGTPTTNFGQHFHDLLAISNP